MPCCKCNADFNLLNWKLKCIECEEYHCSKCLRKNDNYAICGTCAVLIKRPPVREELMDLKVKDLQNYLNKHKISTYGLVEKQELVELFFRNVIPVRYKKTTRKFPVTLGGSVPNLTARSQAAFNNIKTNAETVFNNATRSMPRPNNSPFFGSSPTRPTAPPPPPQQPTQQQSPNVEQATFRSHSPTTEQNVSPTPQPTTSTNRNFNEHPTTVNDSCDSPPPRKFPKITDFSLEDLNSLSVKQIKELLALYRVDYKGCVEKAELLERVQRLWNDSNKPKAEVDALDECCKICMDAPLDCVLLECGHIAACIECGKRLSECPICRQYVTRVVRTFKA